MRGRPKRDDRLDARARLLDYTTRTAIPICVVYAIFATVSDYPLPHIVAPLAVLAATVHARACLARGDVAKGGLVVLVVAWLGELSFLYQEGWRSPTMTVFFVIIILAASLHGPRAVLVVTVATILAVLSAGYAETVGWFAPTPLTEPWSVALTWTWTLVLGGVVLHTFVGLLFRALERVESERQRSRELMEASPDGIVVVDDQGRVTDVNEAMATIVGVPATAIQGKRLEELPLRAADDDSLEVALTTHTSAPTTHRLERPDGTVVPVEVNRRMVHDEDGPRLVTIVRDVSARVASEQANRELEAQLNHAQRLESIGRLAGGVAHEFNNCLTVILGGVDELAEGDSLSKEQRQDLRDVRRAALRAADVTTKLLAFGRRRPRGARVLELNELIGGLETMIRRLVGERIEVELSLDASPDTIWADPTHVEQVLVNLVVNAVDAMAKKGGRLTIRTMHITTATPGEEGSPKGRVQLVVRDTGEGMDEEVRQHIFEPFFSTKAHEEGTGLGLSLVHGIVTQAGGMIEVSSAPGRGTEFRIGFPVAVGSSDRPRAKSPVASMAKPLRVLVVEDEPLVAKSTRRILTRAGHEVVEASTAAEALDHIERVDVLLTDVVLPDKSGPELANELTSRDPHLVVLFMSGYDGGHLDDGAIVEHGLLQKPFEGPELLDMLRQAASRGASGPRAES